MMAGGKPKKHADARHKLDKRSKKPVSYVRSYYFYGVAVCVLSVGCYLVYQGYLETRVNTAFDGPKISESLPSDLTSLWGSYRPGLYFGMRPKAPNSLVTGLMWFLPEHISNNHLPIRHWCDQGDNLQYYSWNQHDGVNFGVQKIIDNNVQLITSFVKRGVDWSARITATPYSSESVEQQISLLYYIALEEGSEIELTPHYTGSALTSVTGSMGALGGPFTIKFKPNSGLATFQLVTSVQGLNSLNQVVLDHLQVYHGSKKGTHIIGLGNKPSVSQDSPNNLIVFQVVSEIPAQLEIVFEYDQYQSPAERPPLERDAYTAVLKTYLSGFHDRFEEVFQLSSKNFSQEEVNFAQAALSNMLGGVGYFYGASKVQSVYNKDPVPYWKAPLLTAVPSRSFFPRGFLWDEGFHNLLIAQWDRRRTKEILAHWFDLMNIEGWIPREQILGSEARARVPSEFIVQRNTNANPPTLMLTLQYLLRTADQLNSSNSEVEYLSLLWPRLKTWFDWFNITQYGPVPGSYRWRGRNPSAKLELNPKTLTSGLDDYPRASHPTSEERHVDLLCWMALASDVMAQIAELLGKPSDRYTKTFQFLTDNNHLDWLHWSPTSQAYMDYGLHTDKVILKKPQVPPPKPGMPPPQVEKVRESLADPKVQFVDSFGYVSLFPFLMQLVDPQSPKLRKIIEDIENPKLLWTKFGLRSLAKSAALYMKRNTEHDPPYWRGPIWININYLAVRALFHYGSVEGPFKSLALRVYAKLRSNLIKNLFSEYKRTGYIWEQYNDVTGQGQGCRPFTGWSSLVVLMMAESY